MQEEKMSLIPDLPLEVTPIEVKLDDLPDDGKLGIQLPKTALVYSINNVGLMQPPILSPDWSGKETWVVRAGRRRIKACRIVAAGDPSRDTIPAWVVHGGTPDQLIALEEALNATAAPNKVEQFLHFEALMQRGFSVKEIADQIGVPQGTVKSRLRLRNLNGGLRKALLSGKITPGNAEEAAKLKGGAQERLVETLADKGKLVSADIEAVKRQRNTEATAQTLGALDLGAMPGIQEVEKAEDEQREVLKKGAEVIARILDDDPVKSVTWEEVKGLEAVMALVDEHLGR